MIRIFVTGDNHIGLRYASHEQAAILASRRIDAFEAMVQTANQEMCHLFVITGDLFENTYNIAKKDIKRLLELLGGFKGIVAVLPGNHDYYDKDVKLWQQFRELMGAHDNIMLLADYRPYPLTVNAEEVILYPALCTSLHSAPGQNNLGWIRDLHIESDGVYRIGIAHGAVQGETIDNEGQYFLMRRDELNSIGMDAWLIGHTHIPFPRELTETLSPCEKIFNAGTHVQTDVACNTEGQCFIVEIGADKAVRARKVRSGNLRFYRKHIALSAQQMDAIVSRELDSIGSDSVVEVILSGAVTAEEYERRHEVLDAKLSRFIEGSYNDYALSKLISRELICAEFPETAFSAALLNALLAEPKEAQLVYEMLKAMKEGR